MYHVLYDKDNCEGRTKPDSVRINSLEEVNQSSTKHANLLLFSGIFLPPASVLICAVFNFAIINTKSSLGNVILQYNWQPYLRLHHALNFILEQQLKYLQTITYVKMIVCTDQCDNSIWLVIKRLATDTATIYHFTTLNNADWMVIEERYLEIGKTFTQVEHMHGDSHFWVGLMKIYDVQDPIIVACTFYTLEPFCKIVLHNLKRHVEDEGPLKN
ncbi:hypothetical protein ACJX0J_018740 [Zea mays]